MTELKRTIVVQDENCHWYVLPIELKEEFELDMFEEDFIDSGKFDEKYSEYRTNGDINNIELYPKFL